MTSTHGRTGFKRALIGSVAEHVVRYAECPVIIVPSRGCVFSMKESSYPVGGCRWRFRSHRRGSRDPRSAAICWCAKTSRDAFRILEDQMPRLDLVVVDVDPGAHGLALLEAISGCADKPPILVITALEETYMQPIALKHGAAACLGKPIAVRRLCSSL